MSTEKHFLELAENEIKFKILVDNCLDGMVIAQDLQIKYVNKAFCDIIGYTEQEIYNMDPTLLIVESDRERVLNIHRKRINEKIGDMRYETVFVGKNGSRIKVELSSTSIQYQQRTASLVTVRDVTEKSIIQEAYRLSEQKYKVLVENSLDGITIIRDNRFLFANDTFCKMLGYTRDELYNMPSVNTLHPQEHAKAFKIAERRRNKDFSTISEVFLMVTKDGEIKECETTATLIEYDGEWASLFTSHDISERKIMEEKLRENEEKYRELVETTNSIILKWDNKFNITFLNEYGLKFFGYDMDEVIGKPMVGTIVPATESNTERDLALLMSDIVKDPLKYARNINQNKRKNGELVWVSWNNTAVRNELGEIIGMYSIGNDITESKLMESELKASEEKYRQLFNAESDAIFMINADSGEILDTNPAASRIYGYTHEEFLRMKNTDVSAEPEKTKIATENRQTLVPLRFHKKKSGEIFPVELSAGFTDLNGTKIQIVTSRDVTERIRSQKALEESEEKYRRLIDNATDGIVITQNGLLKFVNIAMCDMMQYKAEEILEKSFLDYVVKEDHQIMIDYHKRRMSGEHFNSLYRSRFIRKDGTIITVELNARTSDFNGNPAAFIIIRNITERVKIEEDLLAAKSELEKLNHELEDRIIESSKRLTEANTQLINLQKENLQSKFDVLKQQVNPHFLFNSLNVLTSLIKLEPDLAEKFSEQLSKVYRYVLENKDNELVSLKTELDFLQAYIFLLDIRFIDKLRVDIQIPENKLDKQIIPLALQLLIENAIKHNIMSKSEPLKIRIFIDKNNKLNIINNLQERKSQIISTGVGLKNIKNRYSLLHYEQPEFEKTEAEFIAKIPLV